MIGIITIVHCEKTEWPKSPLDPSDETNSEAHILSFIVRVWREETMPDQHQGGLRGHITPIPNNQRHYFSDIQEIPTFITAYFQAQS